MLLTHNRIVAASRICRFNGWTNRHYSILEHSVIGANVLREMGFGRDVQKAFLLHDIEETEFTDIVTPLKERFMTANYQAAVHQWEFDLCVEVGLPDGMSCLHSEDVKFMDTVMLSVESHTVSTMEWRGYVEDCPEADIANRMILSREFKGKHAVAEFWRFYNDLA